MAFRRHPYFTCAHLSEHYNFSVIPVTSNTSSIFNVFREFLGFLRRSYSARTMIPNTKHFSTIVKSSRMYHNVLFTLFLCFMLLFKCCNKALSSLRRILFLLLLLVRPAEIASSHLIKVDFRERTCLGGFENLV